MKIFVKLGRRGGFSLTELLVSVLILALVGTVVGAGIPAAVGAFKRVVEKANAQILLTTTANALRNELDMASGISVDLTEKIISFTSSKNYNLKIMSTPDGIKVKGYTEGGSGEHTGESDPEAPLVSGVAASKNLRVEFEKAEYHATSGTITITDISVKNSEDKLLASLAEYTIVVLR